jgi:CheY-like chemotaxis protein
MDLMMPIMDGYSATKEILKQKPYTSIYGLSAATEPEVIVKGKQCGMQAVIGKPLKKADLYTHLINYYDSLNNPSKTANTLDLKSLFNKEEPLKVLIHAVDSRTTFKLKQYFEEQDNVLTTYISDPDSIIYVCQIQAYDLLLVDVNDNKSSTSKFIHEYVTKRQTTPLILVNTEQQNYLHQSNTLIRFLPLNFNALDIQKVLLHFKEESKTVFINKPTSSQKEYYNEL